MAKIIVRRGDALVEFENEKDWKKEDADVRLFTQDDFNALDAKLKNQYEAKSGEFKTRAEKAEGELATLKQEAETKRQDELKVKQDKITESKKKLSARDLKTLELLEKASIETAYEWLVDSEIVKEDKKTTPITPRGRNDEEPKPRERESTTIF
jgi:hypothetical protein